MGVSLIDHPGGREKKKKRRSEFPLYNRQHEEKKQRIMNDGLRSSIFSRGKKREKSP